VPASRISPTEATARVRIAAENRSVPPSDRMLSPNPIGPPVGQLHVGGSDALTGQVKSARRHGVVEVESMVPRRRRIRYLDRLGLEQFEGEFLGEHDVAHWKLPLRSEAEATRASVRVIQTLDIQDVPVSNAISRAGVATDDLEIIVTRELLTLVW
jgi:hypothetical protein